VDIAGREPGLRQQLGLRAAGAGLLAAAGAIHLDLYLTGYRTIPTIGWLFLLQVIAAFVLAGAVLVSGSRMAAAAGAGFAVATLGGYIASVSYLFGFTEVRTTAGIAAGIIGQLPWPRSPPSPLPPPPSAARRVAGRPTRYRLAAIARRLVGGRRGVGHRLDRAGRLRLRRARARAARPWRPPRSAVRPC
jgi:hypothetical protein